MRVRPLSWVILAVNVLFVVWAVAGFLAGRPGTGCRSDPGGTVCDVATAITPGLGFWFVVAVWSAVDLVLLIAWLVTRPSHAPAPVVPAEHALYTQPALYAETGFLPPVAPPPPPPPPSSVVRSGGWSRPKVMAFCAMMVLLCALTLGGGVWLGREQGRDEIRQEVATGETGPVARAAGTVAGTTSGTADPAATPEADTDARSLPAVAETIGCTDLIPGDPKAGAIEYASCSRGAQQIGLYRFAAGATSGPMTDLAESAVPGGDENKLWSGPVMIDAGTQAQTEEIRWLLGQ